MLLTGTFFNERYLLGIYVLGLPIEEVLFFVAIPYAYLFLYETVQLLIKHNWLAAYQRPVTGLLIVGLAWLGMTHWGQAYTASTCLLAATFLSFHHFYLRRPYLGQFYMTYLVILVPFFVVNSILTGSWTDEAIVWYNDQENLGIRWGTIPLEDVGYGFLLMLIKLTLYQAFQKNCLGG